MIKSTNVFFDSDKLYLIKPCVRTMNNNHVIFTHYDNDIDIGYLNNDNIYGIIKDRKYYGEEYNNSNLYLFDSDKIPLLKYLFEITYNVECNEEMLKHLYDIKKHYEIDELIDLYNNIIDNHAKIKQK